MSMQTSHHRGAYALDFLRHPNLVDRLDFAIKSGEIVEVLESAKHLAGLITPSENASYWIKKYAIQSSDMSLIRYPWTTLRPARLCITTGKIPHLKRQALLGCEICNRRQKNHAVIAAHNGMSSLILFDHLRKLDFVPLEVAAGRRACWNATQVIVALHAQLKPFNGPWHQSCQDVVSLRHGHG